MITIKDEKKIREIEEITKTKAIELIKNTNDITYLETLSLDTLNRIEKKYASLNIEKKREQQFKEHYCYKNQENGKNEMKINLQKKYSDEINVIYLQSNEIEISFYLEKNILIILRSLKVQKGRRKYYSAIIFYLEK